jgi:hypothetical protein
MHKTIDIIQSLLKNLDKNTLRSPEMLAPANTPVTEGKNTANTEKNVSPLKSGKKFSRMSETRF